MSARKAQAVSKCNYNHEKQNHRHRRRTAPIGEVVGTIPVLAGEFESERFTAIYKRERLIEVPIPVDFDEGSLLIRFIAPNGREQFVIAFEPSDEDGTQCEMYFSDIPHRFSIVIDHVEGLN